MTDKPAQTDYPILPEIAQRWSPRAIGGDAVSDETIHSLFEAARWAPSSGNGQPWRYIYATLNPKDAELRSKLESLLVDGNYWAKHAYVLAISFAEHIRIKDDGSTAENYYALHDTGAANAYLALQASALGLAAHQMGGFNKETANEMLGVPERFVPASMMAIGSPTADTSFLNEKHAEQEKAERKRKSQDEFAFKSVLNS